MIHQRFLQTLCSPPVSRRNLICVAKSPLSAYSMMMYNSLESRKESTYPASQILGWTPNSIRGLIIMFLTHGSKLGLSPIFVRRICSTNLRYLFGLTAGSHHESIGYSKIGWPSTTIPKHEWCRSQLLIHIFPCQGMLAKVPILLDPKIQLAVSIYFLKGAITHS